MTRIYPDYETLLTIDQLAKAFQTSKPTLYKLMRQGKLSWIDVGQRRFDYELAKIELMRDNRAEA